MEMLDDFMPGEVGLIFVFFFVSHFFLSFFFLSETWIRPLRKFERGNYSFDYNDSKYF